MCTCTLCQCRGSVVNVAFRPPRAYLWLRDLPLEEHVGPREQRSFLDDWRLVLCCATPSGDCCTHTQIAVGATCHGQAHRNRLSHRRACFSRDTARIGMDDSMSSRIASIYRA